MARDYTVVFENVLVAAAQDLFEVKGAAGKTIDILRLVLGATDTALPTAQMLQTRCQFLPATVTDGPGGSTPTPRKMDAGDAAASFTALANNTVVATTNGTAVTLLEKGDHIYAGIDYTFPIPPVVGPSEAFIWGLLSTVSGTVHLSGTVHVRERGG